MHQPPILLIEQLQPVEQESIKKWWHELPHKIQEELRAFYVLEEQEQVHIMLTAKALGEIEELPENEIWVEELTGLYEYIINHEFVVHKLHSVIGGICSAHPVAQQAAQAAYLPAYFSCPVKNKSCPMLNISTCFDKKAVQFILKFVKTPAKIFNRP